MMYIQNIKMVSCKEIVTSIKSSVCKQNKRLGSSTEDLEGVGGWGWTTMT